MIAQLNGHSPETTDPYEDLFTVRGAATYVGLTPQGVEWNVRKGKLERIKTDAGYRYRKEDLDVFNAQRVSSTIEPVTNTPSVEEIPEQETPPVSPTMQPLPGEAGLLAQVIATAFAQVGSVSNVRLMELREVTRPLRVWQMRLSVDGNPATFRVFSDGYSVWSKMPVEQAEQ